VDIETSGAPKAVSVCNFKIHHGRVKVAPVNVLRTASDQTNFVIKRFTPIVAVTAVCWLVFVVNNLIFSGQLLQYGIVPRHLRGLPGIIWSPFLHASFRHLAANTLPLLILGGVICARSKTEFTAVTMGGILLGGFLTWLLGRTASHIGASGLIFCFFGYLASLAYFKRNIPTLLVSLACIVGYGGLLRGVVPTSAAVSWEGHLAGIVSGVVFAWVASKIEKPAKGVSQPIPGRISPPVSH